MPVSVVNLAQMREWERATWATGQTEAGVIRRVGEKIAARAHKLTRLGDMILMLAGKGHNGDDARAAKKFLDDRKVILLKCDGSKGGANEISKWSRHLACTAQARRPRYFNH